MNGMVARMTKSEPIALVAYEALAERYSEKAESKAENAFIEHPAMRQALGNVSGLSILDAGCGPGFLVKHLIDSGAQVTAFDVSPKMIDIARQRTAERARLFIADMAEPLVELVDGEFDLVASSLAIDYVRDWSVPLREFHRVLKPFGKLIFSVQHPLSSFLWYKPPTAFGVHGVEAEWRGFGGEPLLVPNWYRSIEEMINPLVETGFSITRSVRRFQLTYPPP
jgi:SAM-dependent methyltransferase